jgi:beta-N-acetylhexosaminidase
MSRIVGSGRVLRSGRRAVAVGVGMALAVVLVPAGASRANTRALSPTTLSTRSAVSAVSPSCTNLSKLAGWRVGRLARQTIAVPADETDLAAVTQAAKDGYGGLLLFGSSAPANLGQQLTALRKDVPYNDNLVVMTDEEGGGVQRMANLVGSIPWASYMGAHWGTARITRVAESVGRNMLRNGVNMDLAPVLDVDGRAVEPGAQDPDGFRSFSGKTSVVSADGVAFMQGMVAGGVVPVVKHFPGLGGVSQNTDDGPAHTMAWPILEKVALPPFEAAIKGGAPAVMVSNASVPKFTELPASLSPGMVTRELRKDLGFKGLILTDSLSAGAITDPPLSLSVPEAAVDALVAGDDLVLYGLSDSTSQDLATAAATTNAIVAAVGDGKLSKTQIVDAVAQVLAAKKVNLCGGAAASSSGSPAPGPRLDGRSSMRGAAAPAAAAADRVRPTASVGPVR